MVKQMVTGYSPQADAQKTAPIKGTDEEKGQAGSEALSLLQRKELLIQIMRTDEESGMYGNPIEFNPSMTILEYRLPEVSGFRMARKV